MRLVFCRALRYQSAMSKTPIEELAKKLADSVPDSVRAIRSDLEDGFQSVLQTGLNKLDLVTREEFESPGSGLAKNPRKTRSAGKRLSEIEDD